MILGTDERGYWILPTEEEPEAYFRRLHREALAAGDLIQAWNMLEILWGRMWEPTVLWTRFEEGKK